MSAIATGALATVSGCGLLGRETLSTRYVVEEVDSPGSMLDEEADIEGGSHLADQFEIEEATEIRYTAAVLDGPNLNAFLLDNENATALQAGEDVTAIEGSIALDTEIARINGVELEAGTYTLVVDNGDVQPENA
ncbi:MULTISPECIES: hypothetical protein [unclassified Halorhabdus]|uniref:hypothetical protein n=1 Tax=unclassified Halorhabdus TaxID=2621901 RepID=UPI0023DBA6EC|nr:MULTISPECIES: hypothetical protein [unclassified Halorhabdus]WEL21281.1 Uncharacterized protein HBNXHr_1216 [Halorhabdus sp. BNX81]